MKDMTMLCRHPRKLCVALWLLAVGAAPAQTGVPLWTNMLYGGGGVVAALVVDISGNVVVTGAARPGTSQEDYGTVKYSGIGVPLWTNLYNGPLNSIDAAVAVAVDRSGNVFVTGSAFSNLGFVTIKYSAIGVPLWTNVYYDDTGVTSRAKALAVDGSGSVFVTGDSHGIGNFDFITFKYSNDGMPLWTNSYNGPGNGWDRPAAMVVDGDGNVIVTGYSDGAGSDIDYATIKYSGAGVPLWTNRYNGPANGVDEPIAIAVDSSGNVFVTGESLGNNHAYDFATIKYSASGVELWTRRYDAPDYEEDAAPRAIAVDNSGNVFVTGQYATIKYSGGGVPLWTNLGGMYNIAVDGSGNAFLTTLYGGDYATVAYSGAGVPLWTNFYPHLPGAPLQPAIGVDSSGSIFVSGLNGYVTIKYSGVGLLPIPINYHVVGNQLLLTWTNAAFKLESAPTPQGAYSTISGATSPYTNAFSSAQRFFRLKSN